MKISILFLIFQFPVHCAKVDPPMLRVTRCEVRAGRGCVEVVVNVSPLRPPVDQSAMSLLLAFPLSPSSFFPPCWYLVRLIPLPVASRRESEQRVFHPCLPFTYSGVQRRFEDQSANYHIAPRQRLCWNRAPARLRGASRPQFHECCALQ